MTDDEHTGICVACLAPAPFEATAAELDDAFRAAVDTGFRWMSLWAPHLDVLDAAGRPVSDTGLVVELLEDAFAWGSMSRAAAVDHASRLAERARSVGASRILVIGESDTAYDPDQYARARANFGAVAEAAWKVGVTTCLEFIPWTTVADLATALEFVGEAGPGARLVVDAWHWHRQPGGPDPVLLRQVPGELIEVVQLCDAAARPRDDLRTEARTARLLPGDGVVDLHELHRCLDEIGATPVVAPEVYARDLVTRLGPHEFARRSLTAARRTWPH